MWVVQPTRLSTVYTCDEMHQDPPLLIGGRAWEQSYSCQTLVFLFVECVGMILLVTSWTLDMALLFGLETPPVNSCMARGYPL